MAVRQVLLDGVYISGGEFFSYLVREGSFVDLEWGLARGKVEGGWFVLGRLMEEVVGVEDWAVPYRAHVEGAQAALVRLCASF